MMSWSLNAESAATDNNQMISSPLINVDEREMKNLSTATNACEFPAVGIAYS